MDKFTSWDTVILEIDSFIDDYQKVIKGADELKINRLELLVKQKLPKEYKAFLKNMGDEIGINNLTADFSIDAILEIYSEPSWLPPKNLLVIGKHLDEDNGLDVCLSLQKEDYGKVLNVYFSGDTEYDEANWKSDSSYDSLCLQSMVFSQAFSARKLRYYDSPFFYVPENEVSATEFQAIDNMIIKLGFKRLPLCDKWNYYYEHDSSVIWYRKPMGDADQIFLKTKDEKLHNKLTRDLTAYYDWTSLGSIPE